MERPKRKRITHTSQEVNWLEECANIVARLSQPKIVKNLQIHLLSQWTVQAATEGVQFIRECLGLNESYQIELFIAEAIVDSQELSAWELDQISCYQSTWKSEGRLHKCRDQLVAEWRKPSHEFGSKIPNGFKEQLQFIKTLHKTDNVSFRSFFNPVDLVLWPKIRDWPSRNILVDVWSWKKEDSLPKWDAQVLESDFNAASFDIQSHVKMMTWKKVRSKRE